MKKLLILILLFQSVICFAPGYLTLYIPVAEPLKKVYTLSEKIQAILDVETSNGVNCYNPGETEAVGILQIHPIMVKEVNRILGYQKYQLSDRLSDKMSIQIFMVFQNHYNKTMDFEKMCRLWNGGTKGMSKASTLKYYQMALTNLNT